jgi:transposase
MEAHSLSKKKLDFTWRRIRKTLKPLQNEFEYQAIVVHLCGLLYLESQGFIDLYYGDETRFSMNSYLPYAWQKKGQTIGIIPQKHAGVNVFGLMNRHSDFHLYTTKQNVDSSLIIAFIDDFAKSIKQPTVIVLDNATTHHSEEFRDQIVRWEKMDLFIFYLPKYSPHLNLIETLWRKLKYEWFKQHLLKGTDDFFNRLDEILLQVGTKFSISFKNQLYPFN